MRTTLELRSQIEAAAQASGRSLVQEVEHRLAQSFDHPVFDPRYADLFRLIADTMALVERGEGQSGSSERLAIYYRLRAARTAIDSLIANWTADWTQRKKIAALLAEPVSENQTDEDKP